MRVFISAGEASGDLYGAAIAKELITLEPNCEITGLGGTRMAALGLNLIGDSSSWGSISILQSIREGVKGIATYYRLRNALKIGVPGVFVPIDFGYMNLRLCKWAKRAGWKVLYFIPPGSWRRDRQGADIPTSSDEVVTNFPWSAKILAEMGCSAHFFGHPLLSIHSEVVDHECDRNGLAVLPGSRKSEIEQLMPLLGEALRDCPDRITIPVPRKHLELAKKLWPRGSDSIIDGSQPGVIMQTLCTAKSAIICSGTATLEAVIAKVPMVVVYKVSKAVEIEAKLVRFKRPKFVSQPNIILQREVVPELIQEGLSVESLMQSLGSLNVEHQQEGFNEIIELLSPKTCILKTAELIRSMSN